MKVTGFSKSQPFTPEFNGNKELPEPDQFRVTLTALTLSELITVQDTIAQAQPEDGEKANTEQLRSLVELNGPVLLKHVTIVQGADGFTLEDIAEYAHFFQLALELLKKLNEISQPTERDVKN